MTSRNTDTIEIDKFVGKKIYSLRMSKGMKMGELACILGISQQQLHKYEKGINRISIGRLIHIAKALEVEVAWLYGGNRKFVQGVNADDLKFNPSAFRVAQNFLKIRNKDYQKAVTALVKVLAKGELEGAT
jgi:transcriptional regulator with XRE-family HTH domain